VSAPFPRSIAMQMGLLLLACVCLFNIAVTVIINLAEPLSGPPHPPRSDVSLIAITALDAVAASERPAVLASLNAALPELRASPEGVKGAPRSAPDLEFLRAQLPAGVAVEALESGGHLVLSATLRDGGHVSLFELSPPPRLSRIAAMTIGFVAICLFVFSLWAARSLTRPLRRFAEAAESFGLDSEPAPLAETGPEEVRKATRAFNRMQRRISEMAAQRLRTLAAVSHDLRTPITRLRLRAEFVSETDLRRKLLRDLDQMEAMVESCLSYLRGGAQRDCVDFDLVSLLQTIVDQFVDMGADVHFDGSGHVVLQGGPEDLERAFSNLVDNAVKYADSAEVSLRESGGVAIIEVSDRGAGIPEQRRAAMLEPFERGVAENARKVRPGFGLGLAISRAIVEAHGGRLELDARAGGGLVARVILPIRAAETN